MKSGTQSHGFWKICSGCGHVWASTTASPLHSRTSVPSWHLSTCQRKPCEAILGLIPFLSRQSTFRLLHTQGSLPTVISVLSKAQKPPQTMRPDTLGSNSTSAVCSQPCDHWPVAPNLPEAQFPSLSHWHDPTSRGCSEGHHNCKAPGTR